MTFVLKRNAERWVRSSCYVAEPGSPKSYTTSLDRAQRFDTLDAAQASACGNERPVRLGVL